MDSGSPQMRGSRRDAVMTGMNSRTELFRNASVAVVDDDPYIRRALEHLLRTEGLQVMSFASAEALLSEYPLGSGDCMILDLHLEGMSGLDLFERLAERASTIPVVFLTGGDTRLHRESRAAAIPCLSKPVDGELLLATVYRAMADSACTHQSRSCAS